MGIAVPALPAVLVRVVESQQLEDVVAFLKEHKAATTSALVATPLLYYGTKFVIWYRKNKRIWNQLQREFDGPKKHWLYGNLHQHPGPNQAGFEWHVDLTEKHEKSFLLWMGGANPVVEVCHPDTAKAILATTQPKPSTSLTGSYRLIKPWIGDGLLISNGPKWFRNRRLLTPAFHFDVLRPYMDVFNQSATKFMEKMRSSCGGGEFVEIFSPVSLMTLDVILRCAFSYTDDIQTRGNDHPYVIAVKRLSALIVDRVFYPFLLFDTLFYSSPSGREFSNHCKFAHEVAEKVIRSRQRELQTNKIDNDRKYKDFLDILLLAQDEEGKGLTDLEIRNEVDTFMFEGHDTTASGISWILYTLASHQEHQTKCREEVDALFQGRTAGEDVEWEDLNQIPYLTKCIKEALRIHPPVPFIGRTTDKEIDLAGKKIPAGVNVDIVIYNVHHNPHVWGNDHNEFKPERFDYENIRNMDSHAFIPFSAGPRNCIGQNFAMNEIKVVMIRILHRFILENDPARIPEYQNDVVMRSKDGIYLKFSPR